MNLRADLTAEDVRYWLHYDPDTGLFTWANMSSRKRPIGYPAGYMDGHGYIGIRLRGVCHAAHRLAWLWMTGEWPKGEIDHKNRDRTDNRWDNLRDADHTQNMTNCSVRRHSKSGVKGVWWSTEKGRWRSAIRAYNKTKHIGYFDTVEEARAAYNAASVQMHGEFGSPS